MLRLSPDLSVQSWFTPANHEQITAEDNDLGACGPMLLPGESTLAVGGKTGTAQWCRIKQGEIRAKQLNERHRDHALFVAFAPADASCHPCRLLEAIVPVDRVTQSAPAHAANARVMAAAPISGTTRWVTLMCKFSDLADEQKDLAFFQSQYGEGVGQLGHYWREVSYNKINLTGSTAHGWYTLPNPRSTYVTTVDGKDKADLNKLFADCASAAPDTVDLTAPVGINMMFNATWTAMPGVDRAAPRCAARACASALRGTRRGRSATSPRSRTRWDTVTACRTRTIPMATTIPTTTRGT